MKPESVQGVGVRRAATKRTAWTRLRGLAGVAAAMLFTVFALGVRTSASETTVARASHGPVRVEVKLDPPHVDVTRNVLFSLTVTAPPHVEVTLPPAYDRLLGFDTLGAFEESPDIDEAPRRWVRHLRLKPLLGHPCRIRPIPIVYTDRSLTPARTSWFTTPGVIPALVPEPDMAPADIEGLSGPLPVVPRMLSTAWGVSAAVAALVCIALAVRGWILRTVPVEPPCRRAEHELAALLSQNLVSKGRLGAFYDGLSMIVRRYFDRRYAIHAPAMTTEEFVFALRNDARFSARTVDGMKGFLETTDLVKFAFHQPPPRAAGHAVKTAREFWKECGR